MALGWFVSSSLTNSAERVAAADLDPAELPEQTAALGLEPTVSVVSDVSPNHVN